MADERIRIERIRVKDLPDFAARQIEGAPPKTFIPITMQRAEAQAKNPLAEPDSVGLLVAYLGDEVVGYFGTLAVMLKHGTQLSRVWYFTGWNVSTKVRGQGIGRLLMQEAISLDRDYILAASKFGRKASEVSGLIALPTWKSVRVNFNRIWQFNPFTLTLRAFRKVAHFLGRKLEIERSSNAFNSFFSGLCGWLGKPLLYRFLLSRYKNILRQITITRVERVRETEPLNQDIDRSVRFYRSPEVVNWMLSMPWVLPPGQSLSEDMEYYFADVRPGFEFLPFEVFSQGEYQGYIVFQYSDSGREVRVKVLDVDLPDLGWIFPLALKVARERKADVVEMNYEYSSGFHAGIFGRLLIEFRRRTYQYYASTEDSPLAKYGQEIRFDLTDGDFSFS